MDITSQRTGNFTSFGPNINTAGSLFRKLWKRNLKKLAMAIYCRLVTVTIALGVIHLSRPLNKHNPPPPPLVPFFLRTENQNKTGHFLTFLMLCASTQSRLDGLKRDE